MNTIFLDKVAAGMRRAMDWRWTRRVVPAVLGGAGGYAYYYFVGCVSGACPITSNPWISTAYGTVLGFLLLPFASGNRRTKQEEGRGESES